MIIRKSLDDMTSDDLDQLYADLDRAETEAREWAEAESADAAAGSYAHRAEQAEAERDTARATLARIAALADEYPAGIDTALIHAALAGTETP